MICTICGRPHSEHNEGFPTLCKHCRAEAIAEQDMRSRIKSRGLIREIEAIKNKQYQLGMRISRLKAIIDDDSKYKQMEVENGFHTLFKSSK